MYHFANMVHNCHVLSEIRNEKLRLAAPWPRDIQPCVPVIHTHPISHTLDGSIDCSLFLFYSRIRRIITGFHLFGSKCANYVDLHSHCLPVYAVQPSQALWK